MNEHATLTIEGRGLEVVALEGREAISELFTYDIACTDDLEPRALVRREASITLRACELSRTIEGIVTRAERRASDDGRVALSLTVRPRAFPLTLGRGCRAFQNKNVVAIVDQLLACPHRWELRERYESYEYRAQYREDDWTYVARLLHEEGIYFWFDHDDASELVLADDSRAATELALLDFAFESQLTSSREQCFELAGEARATATRFSVGSFDPRRPALKLASSAGSGSLEHYDAPGAGPRTPEACARRAALLERAAARSAVKGASSSARLTPGRAVTISGHPLARFDRRYLVTEVSYRVVHRRSDQQPFTCRFRAVPLEVAFHPTTHLPQARQAGLQSGVVVGAPGEEIFPDAEGRVRVQLHWDREGARDASSGRWMRVAQRGTAGSMLLPRVGWNILTFNEEGSVDEPSALSRIHDAEHPPSHALPGSKTRMVFKTATSPSRGLSGGSANELYFEDKRGTEQMFMNASRDMSLLVQKDKSEQIGGCLSRRIAVDHDLAVADTFGEVVSGDQSVRVAGNELLRLVGDEGKCVVGNESETIGTSRSLETGGAHQIMVGASRNLQVGSALIDTVMGPITSASGASTHVMVGAAAIRASAQSISESVSGGSLQAIGGAKVELTAGARSISARFLHNEVVGGALLLKTAANLTSKTKVATSYTVGAITSAKAPELVIEAEESIVLTCGKSALVITKEQVELRTTDLKIDDSAKVIDADSKLITHN